MPHAQVPAPARPRGVDAIVSPIWMDQAALPGRVGYQRLHAVYEVSNVHRAHRFHRVPAQARALPVLLEEYLAFWV